MTENNTPWRSPNAHTWMYIGGFLLIVFTGLLLIQIGFPEDYLGLLALFFLVSTYVFVGIISRTMHFSTYLFANHEAPASNNGQALASGMISSGVFILLAGQIYNHGGDALALYSGWILGVALMVMLFSAGVFRSTRTTLSGIIQPDKKDKPFRFVTMLIVLFICGSLALVQLQMVGLFSEIFFSISRQQGLIIMATSLAFCLISGGGQALALVRMIAYPVILICFMTPLMMTAFKFTGNPIPQFAFGSGALEAITQIEQEIVEMGFTTQEQVVSLTAQNSLGIIEFITIMLCLACGIATTPHLLQHFKFTSHAFKARRSGIWSLTYLLLFLSAIPALAAYYRFDIYTNLLGLQLEDLETKADWVFTFSGAGRLQAISICGQYISSLQDAFDACNAGRDYLLTTQDIGITSSMLVITSALLHELPILVSTILLAGTMLAIWTTLDGLLFAGATALSEDGYVLLFKSKASENKRLFLARAFLLILLYGLCYVSLTYDPDPELLFELTFALSAAALFPALMLRIWQRDASSRVIFSTMMVGFVVASALIYMVIFGFDIVPGNGDEIIVWSKFGIETTNMMVAGLAGLIFAFVFYAIVCLFKHLQKKQLITKHEEKDAPA